MLDILKRSFFNFKDLDMIKNSILSVLVALLGFGIGSSNAWFLIFYTVVIGLIFFWYNRCSGILILAMGMLTFNYVFTLLFMFGVSWSFAVPEWYFYVASYGAIVLAAINLIYVNYLLKNGMLFLSHEERIQYKDKEKNDVKTSEKEDKTSEDDNLLL